MVEAPGVDTAERELESPKLLNLLWQAGQQKPLMKNENTN